ncbi:MAG: SMP-30/gluconolactonase/LRE family protein [Gemmataceae bacterium]|nr:SMP-30/gluconolactonase/LRE family protein [Gemmataceae bacterium]
MRRSPTFTMTTRRWLLAYLAAVALAALPLRAGAPAEGDRWLLGRAFHIPSEYTNQESGYFSIVAGHDSRIYIGTAKYGVNAYLIEFNPLNAMMRMVVDVHRVIMRFLTGFAAQAKIHTRNNVGQLTGKIYFGSKQGYPEKGEKRTDYPGGYVLAYDPKTGTTENFGMPKQHHGVISVMPDEHRGLIYVSTCDDGRPIEHSHFMIYDMKKKTYRDLGDTEHSYAFIVLDHKGRAYHPVRGGKIRRYDPDADKVETLEVTVDGQPCPKEIAKDGLNAGHGAVLNWDASPDGKMLWCTEMSTNMLYSFDLTAPGTTLPGKSHGPLLAGTNAQGKPRITDNRAMCVGPTGKVWAAVTEHGIPATQLYLVSYTPGDKAVRNHGKVGVANPNDLKFVDDKGKPLPWHHAMRKEKDGTLTPWVPMGVCEARDGHVYVLTIAPFTLLQFTPNQLK